MIRKFILMLRRLLGIGGTSVESLRKRGAKIGDHVRLYDCNCNRKDATCLEIGNNVTLSGVRILTHDASLELFTEPKAVKIGRVVIGNNVFVGVGSIILPNVRIGNNVIIGAGSVVSKSIPDDSIAVGNPARVIGTVSGYVKKHSQQMTEDNMFRGLRREDMNAEEINELNKQIEGKIAYIID